MCRDVKHGVTTPGAPKICRMGCGRAARYQPGSRGSLGLCCGPCIQTDTNEHAENCGENLEPVPFWIPATVRLRSQRYPTLSQTAKSLTTARAFGSEPRISALAVPLLGIIAAVV